MPPLNPGDPGDGHGEDDERPDEPGFRPPLPPDDRLWRHPSEVALERGAPSPGSTGAGAASALARRQGRGRTVASMVVAGMIGATLAVGAVAALGGFSERVVEQRVAVAPAASAMADDDSVAEIANRTGPTVAALRVHGADGTVAGSALVFRSDGYLLTAAHLVDGATSIDVVLHRGPAGEATVVGIDPLTDVAVLHVDEPGLQTAALGTTERLRVGARAVAVGATADGGWDTTVATGVVSAMGRRLEGADGAVLHDMILVDVPFPAATTGGAVVDASGAVVGIVSGVPATGGDGRLGAATPIEVAHIVADQIIEHGRATHVWLGIEGDDLDGAEAAGLGMAGAARVQRVLGDSPAHTAGLRGGDLVVGVDDTDVASMEQLIAALRRHVPGDEVVLWVRRGDEVLPLTVTLGARPGDD